MLCLNDGFSLVLKNTVILLLLADTCRGQSEGVGSSQTVVTFIGEDVLLPCHLEPAQDAVSKSFEWGRTDLEPRFVHVWFEGQDLLDSQNPSYKGRTSVSIDNLKHGDLSLKLSAVKLSDNGIYRCLFPSQNKKSNVELVVGSVSSPLIAGINITSSRLVLQCESEGWYPEPEVSWLDGEGHVLSAGPTETPRGPDGLYTVSSRVTVEERHRNNFTCRVQQKDINQTRETQIRFTEDVFMVQPSSSVRIIVGICAFGFLLFSAAFFVFLKRRRSKGQKKKHRGNETEAGAETQQLCTGNTTLVVWDHKQLEEKEEKKKVMIYVISVLMGHKKELENTRDRVKSELEEVMIKMGENEKELKSVESSLWRKDSKKKLSEVKLDLDNKKTEYMKSLESTQEKLQTTVDVIRIITEWKKKTDDQIEQMKQQTDETKRQKDETELQSEKEEETNQTTDSLMLVDGHYTQYNDK